ncbi:MAG: putative quinol monooxygenase [Pirellulales bacterium]|jgi:quinol monooxygenase YgiN
MIHVIATIELMPGKREAFLVEFHKLVPKVLAEKGCIDYGPTIDLATTLPDVPLREHVVTVVERWEDIEALQSHLMAPHMMEYRAKVKEMIVGMGLQVLQPA